MVPPSWEPQKHNHCASRTAGHTRKSWCLHLRTSVVSSNPASASPSPGYPSWLTSATLSKLRRHPIHTTQMTLFMTCIYSLPISQAGMGILEDKIRPPFNLNTVNTVLDSYDLTWNTGSVTFYCCGSCICGNWILLPEESQLLGSWLVLPFAQWWFTLHLWLSGSLSSEGTISLKLMTHLWHRNECLPATWSLPSPVTKTKSWGWECLLLWVAYLFPRLSASCRSPNPNISLGFSRWAPVLG